jgi:LemA protein
MSIYAWIILAVIVLLILWGVASYNRLITMRQQCNQAFADVDVHLQQRHDLVPNLVETVRGYANHERGTLDVVVQARNAAAAAQGPMAQAQAESALSGALRQLFVLAEAYPDLKANSNAAFVQ